MRPAIRSGALGCPGSPGRLSLRGATAKGLLGYRDRLQHSLFIPSRISPLNHLKAPYLEIVNPLQARRVADVVAALPERLRVHPGALARVLERPRAGRAVRRSPAATLQQSPAAARRREVIAEGLRRRPRAACSMPRLSKRSCVSS